MIVITMPMKLWKCPHGLWGQKLCKTPEVHFLCPFHGCSHDTLSGALNRGQPNSEQTWVHRSYSRESNRLLMTSRWEKMHVSKPWALSGRTWLWNCPCSWNQSTELLHRPCEATPQADWLRVGMELGGERGEKKAFILFPEGHFMT
jgi:hypothetical protein